MYQPYPSPGGEPATSARPDAPRSIRIAVKLMYAGAVVDLLSLIASLATSGSLHKALLQAHPGVSASQLHTEMTVLIVADVIIALVSIGLWVGLALASRAGRSWARIAASVLFAIDTVLEVRGLTQASATISSLVALVVWLIGLGAIVMMWRRESSAFFSAAGGSRIR